MGTPAAMKEAIDKVTDADVAAVAKKILGSKPTVVASGDIYAVPHYTEIWHSLGTKA